MTDTPAAATMSTGTTDTIRPKERDAVIQALRAGVVPRSGIQLVQVGRASEIQQVVQDVGRIAERGCAVRFVVGDYGSGKTFFLNLARSIAMQGKLVVVHADLSPDRRIHASGGQAQRLYAELIRNMVTRTKQEGGALASVVERFIMDSRDAARVSGASVADVIQDRLRPIQDLVSGYDFARVIECYWRAYEEGSEVGKAAALRWLRAEYSLKTEAREALGVRSIIDDAAVYDYLKVMSCFVTLAGYGGLLVILDECVNLFKLVNAQARNANYEQILRIVNDVLQGSASSLGVYFAGTPEFLVDSRRGLYSYEALRSRLAENSFAKRGLVDLSGPVVRLQNLTPEDLFILLARLRHVYARGEASRYAVPDEAFTAFMAHCNKKIGESYFRTPRNTIKAFLDLLAVLEQNPQARWQDLVTSAEIEADVPVAGIDIVDDLPADPAQAREPEGPAAQQRSAEPSSDEGLAAFRL